MALEVMVAPETASTPSVPPAATGSSVAGSPASATAGAAAMEATMVNPARAEIVARPRCVVVFIIVPPTLP